jgi:hypothetical protein
MIASLKKDSYPTTHGPHSFLPSLSTLSFEREPVFPGPQKGRESQRRKFNYSHFRTLVSRCLGLGRLCPSVSDQQFSCTQF